MSSTTIEKEIVQMDFDAKGFQKGTAASIESLATLKKAFDFSKIQESLGQLEQASKIDFSRIGSSLESINGKLSTTGIAIAAFVSRITNAVIDAGKKMVDALVLTPILTGLQEYETQLNAVQTILANTSKHGTTLGDVTAALDELNLYADKTIYNFTQMTDSIGKFTTAGVDLDTSVAAIKGIANAAALSGSNAEQASRAMYQLSQAISSGTVRLQDWISVENAGMGGQIFQDSLTETARVHGVAIDSILAKAGGFRASLAEKWLTSDIMLETLQKFTGDLTDAELESLGYSEDQILAIQKVAEMANDAATKIKTLTQLKDTMAEALQSGWSETWRIVFGDFEEAKLLWGRIGEYFGNVIGGSAEARNELFGMWKDAGGREAVIRGFFALLDAGSNILRAFGEAVGSIFDPIDWVDLFQLTFFFMKFAENLKMVSEKTGPFKSVIRGLAAGLDILRLIALAVLKPIVAFVKTLTPGIGTFGKFAASLGEAVVSFRDFALETGFFDTVVANVIAKIGELIARVVELANIFWNLEVVQNVVNWFREIDREDFVKMWEDLQPVIYAVVGPIVLLARAAKELFLQIKQLAIVETIVGYFNDFSWKSLTTWFGGLADSISKFFSELKNSDLVKSFVAYLDTFDGRRFTAFFTALKNEMGFIKGLLDSVIGRMQGFERKTKDVRDGFGEVGKTISESLTYLLDWFRKGAQSIDFSSIFEIINTGLLAGLLLAARKIVQGGWLTDALDSVFGRKSAMGEIATSMSGIFKTLEGTLSTFQANVKAEILKKIAISIALLAGSIFLLTLVDSSKLLSATATISTAMLALFGASGALKAINPQDAVKAGIALSSLALSMTLVGLALRTVSGMEPGKMELALVALTGGIVGMVALISTVNTMTKGGGGGAGKSVALLLALGVALTLIFGVVKKFGDMEAEKLTQGLEGIAGALAVLVGATIAISKLGTGSLAKAGVGVYYLAGALIALAAAIKVYALLQPEELAQGLQSVGLVLGGFAVFTRLLNPAGLVGAGVGMLIMAGALLVVVAAVKLFSLFDYDALIQGLMGVAAAMAILVVASILMSGTIGGAAAMLIMAFAVTVLSGALLVLGSMDMESLKIALLAMAGAFLVLGLAGLALTYVLPSLLLLGVSMLLIGSGAMLMGLGLVYAATGLVALSASGVAVAGMITVLGNAIITLLPGLGTALGGMITNFFVTIDQNSPKIIESFLNIIMGMIQGFGELIPEIVITTLDMIQAILDALVEKLPDLINAGWDILLAFLQGIADHIQEAVDMGLTILTETIKGINSGLPQLVDASFELIITYINAMADAIDEHLPDLIKAGKRLGDAIAKGMGKALEDSIDEIMAWATRVGEAVLKTIKETLGIRSPSKETYWVGKMVILGFINGVKHYLGLAVGQMKSFGNTVQEGMLSVGKMINDALDADLSFNPVITPVLNLDEVSAGAAALDASFRNSSIQARLSYATQPATRPVETAQKGRYSNNGVTFVQNNYSPKALDRTAIYRQTRTLTARLAQEEFSK